MSLAESSQSTGHLESSPHSSVHLFSCRSPSIAEIDGGRIEVQTRVFKAIAKLEDDPRPPKCKKLKGSPNWRIRVGDFRVVYEIVDDTVQINIVKIGHRKEVYV
ncbi:MAG: type II toxin-antitoxin system RelE/ParE family toxin [Bdellovibrionales bacterium]|nr:type II toxin-antitoxin system RelE/ParE family toxin [Bdellovibrionales bacterium]